MEQRPRPEALLEQYHLNTDARQGRLKIFFGYAAGVGKTYAMLEAAHQVQAAGVDVVAGYVEPHTRPDTLELLDGLEQLPPLKLSHRGITLREFDLDAALRRHPRLILVDELAHTNGDGCRHAKRYQDVEELLRAGIDVYTTVNVQHLESLNDVVSAITGITVRERVPDWIFDSADQVEVVDIEPEALIARLQQGKIYREGQAQKALSAFFTVKNLAALREIALRRTADQLGRMAQKVPGSADAGELILTCLSPAPSNGRVIRTAARMSEAFDGRFVALLVETSGFNDMEESARRQLQQNVKLAEDLGAQINTVYGDDIAAQIAEYAKISGVTKIVLGRTNHRRGFLRTNRNLIDKLTSLAPNLDIYIIPDTQPEYHPHAKWRVTPHLGTGLRDTLTGLAKGLLLVVAATAIGLVFFHLGISEPNIIIVYLLALIIAAIWSGDRLSGAVLSVVSVLAFNFFFAEPRFTFQVYEPSYPVTFAIMFVSYFLATTLVIRIRQQSRQAARKAYRTEVLLETSQKLQTADSPRAILDETAMQLQKLLNRPILFYTADAENRLAIPSCFPLGGSTFPADGLTDNEKAVAQWVYRNNKHAGATTGTLGNSKCLYLAVRGQNAVFAVAGIYFGSGSRELDAFTKNLMIAILGESGLALEKQQLLEAKTAIELQAQQDQLRANLLRAISHDLRTPLTSISGNAGILLENGAVLDEEQKRRLYTDIHDDSLWLIRLVENLLSITRIDNGSLSLDIHPELIDDIFREALAHLDRHASEHTLTVELEDDLLMAEADPRLIVQVVINLVNNAIAYTPAGSHIVLGARKYGRRLLITVADDGPGVSDEAKVHLFDMFYTASNPRMDGRRRLGLGLALCRSIVEAHGGTIQVRDHIPHGSEFRFTLKAAEVNIHE